MNRNLAVIVVSIVIASTTQAQSAKPLPPEKLNPVSIPRFESRAQLVGFTSMFMQNAAVFSMARKLKALDSTITIVIGGANCESPMGQVIAKHVPAIDYVFSGPALKTFPELVQHCLNKEPRKIDSLKGVFTKRNYFLQSGPEAIGEELSIDVPIDLDYQPFLKTLAENFPQNNIEPILLFETSRGCWWGERAHCTFAV